MDKLSINCLLSYFFNKSQSYLSNKYMYHNFKSYDDKLHFWSIPVLSILEIYYGGIIYELFCV